MSATPSTFDICPYFHAHPSIKKIKNVQTPPPPPTLPQPHPVPPPPTLPSPPHLLHAPNFQPRRFSG